MMAPGANGEHHGTEEQTDTPDNSHDSLRVLRRSRHGSDG